VRLTGPPPPVDDPVITRHERIHQAARIHVGADHRRIVVDALRSLLDVLQRPQKVLGVHLDAERTGHSGHLTEYALARRVLRVLRQLARAWRTSDRGDRVRQEPPRRLGRLGRTAARP
jgi:hypothetical protein